MRRKWRITSALFAWSGLGFAAACAAASMAAAAGRPGFVVQAVMDGWSAACMLWASSVCAGLARREKP